MVISNITRNRPANQRVDYLTGRHPGADVARTDAQMGEKQWEEALLQPLGRSKLHSGARRIFTGSYANYSKLHNCRPFMPAMQGARLVLPDHQKECGPGMFAMQLAQGVHGVTGPLPQGFARVDLCPGQVGKGQPGHCNTVRRRRQSALLVPGVSGRKNDQQVQLQLRDRRLGQRMVGAMRRVESTAEQADATRTSRQTQSLRTRNLR